MPAVPPYAEDTCRCGHGRPPVDRHGPYRGRCAEGKAEAVAARSAKMAGREPAAAPPPGPAEDANVIDLRAAAARKGKLPAACRDLVKAAEKETAVEGRAAATIKARSALGEFKEALAIVGRVAQSLVNQRLPVEEER